MGIDIKAIGVTAACGVILFFVGAIVTHVRSRLYSFGSRASFLLLAVAALVLIVASL